MVGQAIPETIIVADDHPLFLEAVCINLQQAFPQAQVVRVASYPELIGRLTGGALGESGLILMDLNMPGMTALAGLQTVLDTIQDMPVIVISGSDDVRLIQHILSLGVAGYIPKSMEVQTIEDAIHLALQGEQYRPQHVPVETQAAAATDTDLPDLGAQRMEDALNALSVGIVYLDRDCRIHFMNTAASRILINGHGVMANHDGILKVYGKQQNGQLAAVIDTVIQGEHEGVSALVLKGTQTGQEISAMVAPVAAGAALEASEVMLFITERGNACRPDVQVLKDLYGLTGSEAKVVRELILGKSLEAIAAELNVATNTVRSHLKAVYTKTGTCRQAELVSLVMTGPACIAAAKHDASED